MPRLPPTSRTNNGGRCRCARDFKHWAAASGLPPASLGRLAAQWQTDAYAPGESLFHQGGRPSCIYFVHSGRVKLVRSEGTGRRRIVRIISGPDVLGERALIAGKSYAAAAEAMEKSWISRIAAERFQELWDADPGLPRFFARLLAERLGESDESGSDLALRLIRERVAKLIVRCDEASGAPGGPISLGMSRQDLAELMGTAPEVVSRTFASLAKKRLISVEGRTVRVLEPLRLRQAAGMTSIIPRHDLRHCPYELP